MPEPEDHPRPIPEEPEPPKNDEPAWPPAEARPAETPADETAPAPEAPAASSATSAPETSAPGVETPAAADAIAAVEAPAAAEAPAAEPKQEMGLSESTLHWLVDGEMPVETLTNDPATAPHYDSRAPVAGRRRTVAVVGGAAILAFVVAGLLHAQAARPRADAQTAAAEPADVLTHRAEAALGAGRSGEAMDLAHLAIATNPRYADAYMIVGKVQRDSGRLAESRDAFRKYLDLAPIGAHAEEARAALTTLPP